MAILLWATVRLLLPCMLPDLSVKRWIWSRKKRWGDTSECFWLMVKMLWCGDKGRGEERRGMEEERTNIAKEEKMRIEYRRDWSEVRWGDEGGEMWKEGRKVGRKKKVGRIEEDAVSGVHLIRGDHNFSLLLYLCISHLSCRRKLFSSLIWSLLVTMSLS